ncbi:electron transfer flavoprotein alpha subunit apoprotein [Paenibacillus tianmuensis]|uniref:Electron transfer flavoprotein alpha subunit apoprotein n=1 Tax=Paenibacillus tianmuensis TaxID=624147 RepID=A0A1G4R9K5_9BACL|nr:FAD-binding protein [Paenibacillus tianmuensis]SCW53331.1 electron transfer flavoprotein alpha subunit apoprotein [Paenibacillus tianmuensis]
MSQIRILQSNCIGCGTCVQLCPFEALRLLEGQANVDQDRCVVCGSCVPVCPADAIVDDSLPDNFMPRDSMVDWSIPDESGVKSNEASFSGICVYAEHADGALVPSVPEVIGAARQLAEGTGLPVSAVLLGSEIGHLTGELLELGVDEVWLVDSPNLQPYAEDAEARCMSELLAELKPAIVLGSGTRRGRSIFPRVAARLDTGLCADCISLSLDKETGHLVVTRPAYGGSIVAKIVIPHQRPQMATIKEHVFRSAAKVSTPSGIVRDMSSQIRVSKTVLEILEIVRGRADPANLLQADTIVAVGRGIKKAENLPLIYEFADAIGASVGATRAAVDLGWIHPSHQIGQTGSIVKPRVYFACGISGALQHTVGMDEAETIIAVNSDPNAPIFDLATYGIVGDLLEVIPAFIETLKVEKQQAMI